MFNKLIIKKRKKQRFSTLSRNLHWDVHFFKGSKYVNIAACFLAVNNEMVLFIFIEQGQDKIPPPHQVRSTQSRPGLCPGSALQQEQGRPRQGVRMSSCYCWHYQQCRCQNQTLDQTLTTCKLPSLASSPHLQRDPVLLYC